MRLASAKPWPHHGCLRPSRLSHHSLAHISTLKVRLCTRTTADDRFTVTEIINLVMEKEHQPESMATITMKPEYPASEAMYSTSEPPPAYRQRESSSVQIARIVGLTIVAASFIVGAFILASSWVTARSSCHQLEQLDAMLDKELALNERAYGNDALIAEEHLPVGNAHALHADPPTSSAAPATVAPSPTPVSQIKDDALSQAESKVDEDKLQKLDNEHNKNEEKNPESGEDSSDSDSSAEEEDELDAIRPMIKLPLQFDLDELAGAFLNANNQKGRMNCVVERRNEDPVEKRFPFNILGAFMPRASHAERIAIVCHGGDEPRQINTFPEPQSQVFAFPLAGPMRLPLRPQVEAPAPPSPPSLPAEPRMPPFPHMMQHRPMPFPLPMPWESSEEQMGGGSPREMRIQVQRVIAIPSPHNMPPPPDALGAFQPPPPPASSRDQNQQPSVLHQFVPQRAPTQELEQPDMQKLNMEGSPMAMSLPWSLTPEELHVIHRTAEDVAQRHQQQQIDNDMQEVKTIVNTLAVAAEAEAQAQAQAEEQQHQEALEAREAHDGREGREGREGRTMMLPQEMALEERPHYVQPRSVRDE